MIEWLKWNKRRLLWRTSNVYIESVCIWLAKDFSQSKWTYSCIHFSPRPFNMHEILKNFNMSRSKRFCPALSWVLCIGFFGMFVQMLCECVLDGINLIRLQTLSYKSKKRKKKRQYVYTRVSSHAAETETEVCRIYHKILSNFRSTIKNRTVYLIFSCWAIITFYSTHRFCIALYIGTDVCRLEFRSRADCVDVKTETPLNGTQGITTIRLYQRQSMILLELL